MTAEKYMQQAFALAQQAAEAGEVPVGAVVVLNGQIIGEGYNQPIINHDPTAHAEIQAIRAAAQHLGNYRLVNCDLYVTLEPCMMCVGAMVHARIRKVFFGAKDPKSGVAGSQSNAFEQIFLNHHVEVQGGILAQECGQILKEFFAKRR